MPFIQTIKGLFSKIIHPEIDPNQLTGKTAFEQVSYVNSQPVNVAMQITIWLILFGLWLLIGLGKGKSTKIRLMRANYWYFFVILLVLGILFILYDFPVWLIATN